MLDRTENTQVPTLLGLLASRRTAAQFDEPAPDDEQIRLLIIAADRAPDHGKLRPWRVSIVAGEARKHLGDMFAQGALLRRPDLTDRELQREKSKALRAPLVLIVSAKVSQTSTIPAIEQVMAVSAAVQNILIAAQAMGLAAAWKTGAPAYDEAIKARLGLQNADQIVAFIYLGGAIEETLPKTAPRGIDDIVSRF